MDGCMPIATATLFSTSLSLSPSVVTNTVISTEAGDDTPRTEFQTSTTLVPSSILIPTATLFTTPVCDSKSEVDVGGTTRVPASRASPSMRASATGTQTLTTALTVTGAGNQTPSVVLVTLTQTLSQTSAVLVLKTAEEPPPDPNATSQQSSGSSSNNASSKAGPIAGGVIGLVAALAGIAALLLWLRKRSRRSRDTRALNDFFNAGAGVGRSTSQRVAGGAEDDEDDDESGTSSNGKARRPTTPGLELGRAEDEEGEVGEGGGQGARSYEMTEQQGKVGWGAHGRTSVVIPSDTIVYDASGRPMSPSGQPISPPPMIAGPRSLSPVNLMSTVPRSMSPVLMRSASPPLFEHRPSSIHDALLMREQSSRSTNSQESRQSLLVVPSSVGFDVPPPASPMGALPLSHASTPMVQRSAPTSPELRASAFFGPPPSSSPPHVDAFASYLANGPGGAQIHSNVGQSQSLGRSSSSNGRYSRGALAMTVATTDLGMPRSGNNGNGMIKTQGPIRSESTGSLERPRSGSGLPPISPIGGAPLIPYHRSPRHSMQASQDVPTTTAPGGPRSPQPSPPFSANRIVGGGAELSSPPRPRSRTSFGGGVGSGGAEYPPSRYSHLDVGYPAAVPEGVAVGTTSHQTQAFGGKTGTTSIGSEPRRSSSLNSPSLPATTTTAKVTPPLPGAVTPTSQPISTNGSSQGTTSSLDSSSPASPSETTGETEALSKMQMATTNKSEDSTPTSTLAAVTAYHTSLVKQASAQLMRGGAGASPYSVDAKGEEKAMVGAPPGPQIQGQTPSANEAATDEAQEQSRLERLAAARLWGWGGAKGGLRVANGEAVETPE